MLNALIQLGLFAAKVIILFLFILFLLIAFFMLIARAKEKNKERLHIKHLNEKYNQEKELILATTLAKKDYKKFLKERKKTEEKRQSEKPSSKIYVLNFYGDLKASSVANLSEEVTAILNVATSEDEVVLRLESAGGVVHGYGLAAAQLMRIRAREIPLIVTIDKVAASGGYLMACVANKILCAPFAIIGSIGVIVQLPNFHRFLEDNHIDFEQYTAGEFKRTITLFGKNTDEGRKKLQEEIEDVHQLFKNLITNYRKDIDIQKVATGEYWLGQQALDLRLVDEIKTSDDYLLERSKAADLYEISYEIKKSFFSRFIMATTKIREKLFSRNHELIS